MPAKPLSAPRRVFPGGNQRADVLGSVDMITSGRGMTVDCGGVAHYVKLDPAFTRPGALVAVGTSPSDPSAQVLAPGQVAHFPRGVERFQCWNAMGNVYRSNLITLAGWAAGPPYSFDKSDRGHVGFLISSTVLRDDPAPVSRPEAGLLSFGALQVGDFSPVIVAAGLRGIRVAAYPTTTPAGADGDLTWWPTVPLSNDLAYTLRPWIWSTLGLYASGGSGSFLPPDSMIVGQTTGDLAQAGTVPWANPYWVGFPNREQEISRAAFTVDEECFDRSVPVGSVAFAFELVSLSGTDPGAAPLTDLAVLVEGF